MIEFIRKFLQLNGRAATIILKHNLFGIQRLKVQELKVINDEERLGLVLIGQEVYVLKNRLQLFRSYDNVIAFADDKLQISIKI